MEKAAKNIRVLIVDDSQYMRFVLSKILKEAAGIEVIGEARDGVDALRLIEELGPDVVTLDVEMPRMDGMETLVRIMEKRPTPVIMVSQHTGAGMDVTIKALEAGAVDFVRKPEGRDSLTLSRISVELVEKIRVAAVAKLGDSASPVAAQPEKILMRRLPTQPEGVEKIIVIGSSTGGPKALVSVLSRLPGDVPFGIFIVQHMPAGFTAALAARLNNISALSVSEAKDGDRISAGRALLAPGGFHMRIMKNGSVHLSDENPVNGVRPAVDLTMRDAAGVFGDKVVGVVLTGMGVDGTSGCAHIKLKKGITIAQLGMTCVVNGMPASVINAGLADRVIALDKIAGELASLA